MNRTDIADHILSAIRASQAAAMDCYESSAAGVGHFYIDNVLPEEIAYALCRAFPRPSEMALKRSLKEDKFVSANMDRHDPLIEEALYAFQDDRIVEAISQITGLDGLEPDKHLYAGGISLMRDQQFLNPHLDNSHDRARERWRVLNLLYYVTPDWQASNGGSLELWPDGPTGSPVVIPATFNRLTVMATHDASWHSVNPIASTQDRRCISNYYFSRQPIRAADRFHVTSFRGRPGQPIRDVALRVDAVARKAVRQITPKKFLPNRHVYTKSLNQD